MERDVFRKIVEWNNGRKRKPLILMGARQVGKTWLMDAFADRFYPGKCVRVDLQKNVRLRDRIETSDLDARSVVDLVQAATGKAVVPGETLLVLDEIQESPRTLNALKYFNQELPDLAVMVAGSLLGLAVGKSDEKRKASAKTSFPVGKVHFLDVAPMSFSEFLRALGNPFLVEAVETGDWKTLDAMHDELVALLRKYFFAGGMPEAVAQFAENGDYAAVRTVQEDILRAYDADFAKHAPPDLLPKIRLLWNNVPAQLAKENKKFVYAALKTGARAREYESALQWLDDAGVVRRVFRVSPPRIPLRSYRDVSAFKLYVLDVGLLGTMSGVDSRTLLDGNALFTNFKGAMTEQFVLQEAVAAGFEPHYWSSDSGNAEAEFALQGAGAVFPVEAKAGVNTKAKSLQVYRKLFRPPFAIRTSLQPHRDGTETKDVPLYAFGARLGALLSSSSSRDC